MRGIILAAIAVMSPAISGASSATFVLTAAPDTVITGSETSVSRPKTLSDAEKNRFLVLIQKANDGSYFWASRENRELMLIESAGFATFVDPSGGGYVKVSKIKEDGCDGYRFMEHVTILLTTLTYWGCAPSFAP